MATSQTADQWQELQKKVEFLKRPSSYPEKTTAVETIETHMSWVFLTDQYAYKLKKPVHLTILDFSTLEARHLSAKRELKLNKWLAPGVYLGVFPLVADEHDHLRLGTADRDAKGGRAVDWLLKMKRLPRNLMLDQIVVLNHLLDKRLRLAAEMLTDFYRTTGHIAITPADYRKRLAGKIRENHEALSSPGYGLDRKLLEAVHEAQLDQLELYSELFDQRVREGRIVDGHGDLRPEHICLTSPPVIIDRLEVDPAERIVDPVDELAFLFMECDMLRLSDVSEVFSQTYRELSGDDYPVQLSLFFKSLRACTRAKFSVWHLDDPRVKDRDKWRLKADRYLDLADVIHERFDEGIRSIDR